MGSRLTETPNPVINVPKPLVPLAALALLLSAASGVSAVTPAFSLGWYEASGGCDDGEAANPGSRNPCRYDVVETNCGDGIDNDSDERTDGEDPDCRHGDPVCDNETAWNAGGVGECAPGSDSTHCSDALDNDNDGRVDCDDPDCAGSESCACVAEWWNPASWLCAWGGVDTGVGAGDPNAGAGNPIVEPPLPPGGEVPAGGSPLLPTEICEPRNSIPTQTDPNVDGTAPVGAVGTGVLEMNEDEDGDGLVNCDDPDCHTCDPQAYCYVQGDPQCGEVCDNGIDDDGDGDIDCQDSDCASEPSCTCPNTVCEVGESCRQDCVYEPLSHCADGVDNDEDWVTDCDDSDCAGAPNCKIPEDCTDGIDNDGDGKVDCDDVDCWFDEVCIPAEDCFDGYDNDGDGDTDCADSDCSGEWACQPETDCTNGIDDDFDGATDCADIADCAFNPECENPEQTCDTLRAAIDEIEAAIAEIDRWLTWLDQNANAAEDAYNSGAPFEFSGAAPDGSTYQGAQGPDAGEVSSRLGESFNDLAAQRQPLVSQLADLRQRLGVCESNGL